MIRPILALLGLLALSIGQTGMATSQSHEEGKKIDLFRMAACHGEKWKGYGMAPRSRPVTLENFASCAFIF